MEPRGTRRDHQHYEDLLGAVALGAATPEERQLVLAHASTCVACQAELSELWAVVTALPLAVDEREPSPILRYRIQSALQHESVREQTTEREEPARPAERPDEPPAPTTVREMRPRSRAVWLWATAALVLLVVSAGLVLWNITLQRDQDQERDAGGETIAVQLASPAPGSGAELAYFEDRGVFMLSVHDLPEVAEDEVYQVWLIGDDGAPPVPVGAFGESTSEVAVAADRARYQTLAVTVEPGPLGSPGPTSDPILVAQLDPAAS
ncbi:MAG: anti-sigma factor [Chloroflexia bacterium]|nr:anti-sigma factor [Chloroflexia bacterium]